MDEVEREYMRAINRTIANGDYDLAYDLSVGLKQYKEHYAAPSMYGHSECADRE